MRKAIYSNIYIPEPNILWFNTKFRPFSGCSWTKRPTNHAALDHDFYVQGLKKYTYSDKLVEIYTSIDAEYNKDSNDINFRSRKLLWTHFITHKPIALLFSVVNASGEHQRLQLM